VHKNALDPERRHPIPGSHPRKRGPCSAVRGRTWLRFVPCLRPISPVFLAMPVRPSFCALS